MKITSLVGMALIVLSAAGSVFAHGDFKCEVPVKEWKPQDDLEDKLKSEGWEIRKIKIDNGCYEVYGFDRRRQRKEVYFNPKTFEVVGEIKQN
ncbi:MAG: PepSY domain-containing protein [Rubrivivax sp.]|nr:MAG: PepSY domain-containing protein [Rubrivivax sp.]